MISLYTNNILNNKQFYHYNFIQELEFVFGIKSIVVEKQKPSKNRIHVFICLARWLFKNYDYINKIKGKVVIIEHDGYLNFMPESPFYLSWDKLYKETNFDLLVSSGKQTSRKFISQGIPSVWVPKGCDKKMLSIKNKNTNNICCFGTALAQIQSKKDLYFYKSRNQMRKITENIVDTFQSSVEDFPEEVSKYSAGCINDSTMCEPMSKHFECSALGCVPIRDYHEELYDLGYDGESMIVYKDLGELPDIIRYYQNHPYKLIPFQNKATEKARNQTWLHRSIQIKETLSKTFIKMI